MEIVSSEWQNRVSSFINKHACREISCIKQEFVKKMRV